jgi:hypothetical protein
LENCPSRKPEKFWVIKEVKLNFFQVVLSVLTVFEFSLATLPLSALSLLFTKPKPAI